MVSVNLKYYGGTKQTVIDPQMSLDLIKERIYSLTEISPEKQKILGLKKHPTNDGFALVDGMNIIVLGAAENYKPPSTSSESSALKAPEKEFTKPACNEKKGSPCGMINIYGSSCYLNAVIQFLRPVTELTDIVKNHSPRTDQDDLQERLCCDLKDLFFLRETSEKPIDALALSQTLMQCHPQFAEMDEVSNTYAQQDPEELLSVLLEILHQKLSDNHIDQLFKLTYESTVVKVSDPNDKNVSVGECARILPCHVGTFFKPVNNWSDGVKMALETTLTKASSEGVNEEYNKTHRITSLPKYLIIHVLRFEWKKGSELNRTKACRAKVSRRIEFPKTIDMYSFCAKSLQQELDRFRNLNILTDQNEELPFEEGCDGRYALQGIITHEGRAADSGHCVAWVKYKNDEWFKLDDSDCSLVDFKQLDLWGGRGDYHMATLILYKQNKAKIHKVTEANTS